MSTDIVGLFRTLTCGVYVIGVRHGELRNAFTAAWLMQVSYDPMLLALSIHPQHESAHLLSRGRVFSVNVLATGQLDLARHFGTRSGRDEDKLAAVDWRDGITGAPILCNGLSYFDCLAMETIDVGDHQLVLGRVVDGGIIAPDAAPLNYLDTGAMDGSDTLYPRAMTGR
ncbi:MAG: hypothetical protein NVS4B3_24930 [Gemmatimonadaceae bacterium]